MRVAILSLGCKVNQAEMLRLEAGVREKGHEVVGLDGKPALCVINTCSVTAKSDYQSRQLIRRAHKAGARVVVTGCYSELNPKKVAEMEGVESVVANVDKTSIINNIENVDECSTSCLERSRTRYFIKVQDGCDHACSYCVIPKARGRSRSERPVDVVEEIKRAVDEGYKEAVITGIHLGLYGGDIGFSLAGLVEMVLERTEIERIRLSSLEITEVDDKIIDLLSEKRVCRHLHIPLQSGDDEVLRLMNRPYNASFFKEKLFDIVSRSGDIALGTDVIAGFPGESTKLYENTMEFITGMPFTYLHVFPYSGRRGTEAYELPDNVGNKERKRRAAEMREISAQKRIKYLKAQIGNDLEVLLERKISGSEYSGTSENYLKVRVTGEGLTPGSIVSTRIEAIDGGGLVGQLSKMPLSA